MFLMSSVEIIEQRKTVAGQQSIISYPSTVLICWEKQIFQRLDMPQFQQKILIGDWLKK